MIDTESYPRAWEEAFARGCLTETVSRCKACEEPLCQHPDPVFAGIIPASDAHPTTSEAR
jgi:hypothetical protein